MRHAEDDVLDPQGAAALNNLLERRNHGFAAVETKTLRARVLYGEELLESFRLDKLVEHRALAFLGERNFLSGAFDPPLQPSLFSRIGDMHEFEPDGAAIGAAQDLQHFGNGRELKPKHSINENFPVVVGLREAIGGRMQLLVVFWGLDAKRIEVGMEMTAYSIGTDHHQRAHRITGRALEFAGGQRSALAGFRLEFGADPRFGFRPIAVERRNEFAAGGGGALALPSRSRRFRRSFARRIRARRGRARWDREHSYPGAARHKRRCRHQETTSARMRNWKPSGCPARRPNHWHFHSCPGAPSSSPSGQNP